MDYIDLRDVAMDDDARRHINRLTEVTGRLVGTLAWESRAIAPGQMQDAIAVLPSVVQDTIHEHASILRKSTNNSQDSGEAGEAGLLRQASLSILYDPKVLKQLCLMQYQGLALMLTQKDAQWLGGCRVVAYGRYERASNQARTTHKPIALIVDPLHAPTDMINVARDLPGFAQVNNRRLMSLLTQPSAEQTLHIAFHPL